MTIRTVTAWCLAAVLAGTAGCTHTGSALTVRPQGQAVYRCEGGERIVARYYSLSDDSLNFVKLLMPDGMTVTLPQAMSASGARYTDDRQWVWWLKGDSAFAEIRDPNGEWRITYRNCRSTDEKR